jgi:hypothetical protein
VITVGARPLAANAMMVQRRKALVTEGQINELATILSRLARYLHNERTRARRRILIDER